MFTVYVLYSKTFDKIYIGFSGNLEQRIIAHNELGKKGWTTKFRPWIIVHKEEFSLKSDAIRREKELKTATGRNFIRSLVKNAQN